MRIVCASANPKKVEEMSRLMPRRVEFLPRPDGVGDVEETAPTLQGNAIIKAVEVANFAEAWAIADDTGLEVEALDGAPGVLSARYAGEPADDAANRRKLLEELDGVTNRAARFRTVVALVSWQGDMHYVTGECEGTIAESERGANGFGYDSLFIPGEGDGRTFAEMTSEEKDAVSHRARAMAQIPGLIARITGTAPE
ncbi:MAG: RdgB/HAM1 family non-canonical purine NTP pyrophosphatase [Actinobacteria bacterium]|nr:RdgB/HAM1 family non-canonical purine NTP pyrophosphatase [Actinomycetota bacterium]